MDKKRVLITGAAGFLGSHLCDRFIKEGFYVIGMDNLITGSLKNIEHLFGLEDFEFQHHDVSNYVHVSGQLDYILHFASPASPIDYLKIPIQTLKVGSLGTHNLLGLAKTKGARMLIASTSEVYGDPLVHPQTESYYGNVNPIGPRGVYDEAKRFQEAMTMAYHTYHGLETRIVRIFNTYGPRMRLNDGRVLPAFIGQALRGEDLTVFGDGSQTRSFCYVDDLIDGIYRLLFSDYAEPVNVGNPDEITIKEFAEEIIKLTGTDQKVTYKPLPKDDPMQRQPDITKAREILKWEPKVSRADGLKITYDYFKTLTQEELFAKEHNSFEGYIKKISMALEKSLSFLTELNENNDRNWMQDNKPAYQDARNEFIAFVSELIPSIAEFDSGIVGLDPKKSVFRINRDIRFSKDKRHYKNNFGVLMSEGGKKSGNAGYYLHLQPGDQSFVAGGVYAPDAERLAKVRQEIDYNPEELKQITSDKEFVERFGVIQGESLKRAPKGYDESHPNIDLIKLKSFIVLKRLTDKEVKGWSSHKDCVKYFSTVHPFIQYLNVALS